MRPRPMRAHDQQFVLTACSLLALQSEQYRRGIAGPRNSRACVARLVTTGYVDAARSLSGDLGLEALPTTARIRTEEGRASRPRSPESERAASTYPVVTSLATQARELRGPAMPRRYCSLCRASSEHAVRTNCWSCARIGRGHPVATYPVRRPRLLSGWRTTSSPSMGKVAEECGPAVRRWPISSAACRADALRSRGHTSRTWPSGVRCAAQPSTAAARVRTTAGTGEGPAAARTRSRWAPSAELSSSWPAWDNSFQ